MTYFLRGPGLDHPDHYHGGREGEGESLGRVMRVTLLENKEMASYVAASD